MINFFCAMTIIFVLMCAWIWAQQIAKNYADKHPELGTFKQEGLGCGKSCGCKLGGCDKIG